MRPYLPNRWHSASFSERANWHRRFADPVFSSQSGIVRLQLAAAAGVVIAIVVPATSGSPTISGSPTKAEQTNKRRRSFMAFAFKPFPSGKVRSAPLHRFQVVHDAGLFAVSFAIVPAEGTEISGILSLGARSEE